MALLEDSIYKYVGISLDEKPIITTTGKQIPAGSKFYETDTKLTYIFDGTSWHRFSQDVVIKNQLAFAVEHYLSFYLETVTIQANVLSGSNTFILNAGAAPIASNKQVLEIKYTNIDVYPPIIRFFQGEIITVDDQVTQVVVRTDLPIDFDLDITKNIIAEIRATNMNVLGDVDNKIKFMTCPPLGLVWDLTRMGIIAITDSQPDDSRFLDLPPLTWGAFAGFENPITKKYLVNIKQNSGFRITCNTVTYATRILPTSYYGVSAIKTFTGQDEYGTTVRLTGNNYDCFVVYIQDDLTTIREFRIKVLGHEYYG